MCWPARAGGCISAPSPAVYAYSTCPQGTYCREFAERRKQSAKTHDAFASDAIEPKKALMKSYVVKLVVDPKTRVVKGLMTLLNAI